MKSIEIKLREEANELKKIAEKAKKRLLHAPEGRLRVAEKRGKPEYYYKSGKTCSSEAQSKNGRYMKKSQMALVKALAQRDYDQKVVQRAEERIRAIDVFLEHYERTSLKCLHKATNPYRRELVDVDVISDEMYANEWKAIEYRGKSFENTASEIVTENGERVRSKSEKIIADKLFALGVPYRYEYPLQLEPNIVIYPDFTILRMADRKEVYWEHFGKMDDMDYVEKFVYKLAAYERNGIYPGDRLFMTFENGKKPINTRILNEFIKTIFWAQ